MEMKIEIYENHGGKYEFTGTKEVAKHCKVEVSDGGRHYERVKYVADDGSAWVKLDGVFCMLNWRNAVTDGIFAELAK